MTQDRYGAAGRAAVPGPDRPAGQGWSSGRATVPTSPSGPAAPPGRPPRGGSGRGAGPAGGGPPALVGKRRRPRWRRILLATTLTLLLVVGIGAVGGYFYARGLEGNLERTAVFSEITGERPAAAGDTLNLLVLGSDSRDPDASPDDDYRADAIMLLHVPSSRDEAYLISIPRDLWVPIPTSPDGNAGGHSAKINAATVFGGVPLAVMTVESYTGVRVDHVMLLDFAGFVEVTDAVGGVEMEIEQTIESIHRPYRSFEEGTQTLDGEEALDYIRQRKQFADGDFTRMRNQQQFLRSLMGKASSGDTMRNPGALNGFLQAITNTLTVDEDFSLVGVGWNLRNLRGDNLTFVVSPHAGTGSVAGQSVVLSDDAGAEELYAAVGSDQMAQWVADHPDAVQDD